jgi:hypothetical protein
MPTNEKSRTEKRGSSKRLAIKKEPISPKKDRVGKLEDVERRRRRKRKK